MKIYKHISHLFTMQPMREHKLKNAASLEDCGYVADGAVCVDDKNRIVWIGPCAKLPDKFPEKLSMSTKNKKPTTVICKGETWMPGLIDAHTHLVFGGNRAPEMMRKRAGASYLQIAKEGGGIQATVAMTRNCSERELFELAIKPVEIGC